MSYNDYLSPSELREWKRLEKNGVMVWWCSLALGSYVYGRAWMRGEATPTPECRGCFVSENAAMRDAIRFYTWGSQEKR